MRLKREYDKIILLNCSFQADAGSFDMHDRAGRTNRFFKFLQRPAGVSLYADLKFSRYLFLAVAVLGLLSFALPAGKARACEDNCSCEAMYHAVLQANIVAAHTAIRAYIATTFQMHRDIFWGDWMWRYNIGNALMMWTQELTTTAMMEIFSVGAFLDAKHQLETQRLLQSKTADAYRNYKPDVGMCTIGTIARGLGSGTRNIEMTAFAITENQIDRMTNARNSSALTGLGGDNAARIEQLKDHFCDARDASGIMGQEFCNPTSFVTSRNKDVDFSRTILDPLTINANFGNTGASARPEERDVMALASNLYGHTVFDSFPSSYLQSPEGQHYALQQRGVLAKRSVATYSFGSIVGMKSAGNAPSGSNAKYLRAVLQQMGLSDVPETEWAQMVGSEPSYYARMELLSKKIFQQPDFYTNLYDAPVNVERKGAAIQAIRLIQDMDRFNSTLRNEQSLSVLLELYLEDMQGDITNSDGSVGE